MNDLGSLSQCLVESDAEAIGRAHRLRRKALALSMVLQLLVVAGLLLWPLLIPAAIPGLYMVTPLPPYHGTASAHKSEAAAARPAAPRNLSPANSKAFWQPKQIPISAKPSADAPQKFADSPVDISNLLPGSGPGTYIDGGGDTATRMIQIPPPPAKPRAKPQFMGEGVMAAALLRRVQPVYPDAARLMRLSGEVRLRAIIATDGSVRELTLLSGNPLLAQAAMAAVREWRYRPTLLNGQAVAVETYITVNFVMDAQ
ncbi:MAG TPA: energy transducer TonB [Candidatus Acidoferrales bacterium]|jgi:protein TonB